MFAPFQRLGDTDNTTGLGLGLALSKGFTEGMGGTLTPEDTPGGGLTMVIALPVAAPTPTADVSREQLVKILIADDDPQLVRALRITLAAHGYEVVAAPDGAAAIALAAQTHPDIVMVDLGMPRLDGVQVIEALRGWTSVPDHRGVGPHRLGRQGRGAGCRRRRLRHQAVPDRRAARTPARAVTARSAARAMTRRVLRRRRVDLATKSVTRGGARVHLTPTEWRILEFLARNPGSLVTRQALLKDIWGTEQVADTGYLRLYISQLRKKLEADPARPAHLLTESGMGYRLLTDTPAA